MKITLKKAGKNLADYDNIKRLYKTAFPVSERAPFFLLAVKRAEDCVDFYGVYADGEWAGMVYAVKYEDLVYIFYLAVSDTQRGKGVGSGVLSAFKKKYKGRRIFLALEELDNNAQNLPQRLERRKFYEKNGFKAVSRKIREEQMWYDVMCFGGEIKDGEYEALMKNYFGKFLFKFICTYSIKTESGLR